MDENKVIVLRGYGPKGAPGMSGDGVLLYPGKDHVLPSIRLAQIRDCVHVSNCFISECLGNMTHIASLLGHPEDAQEFAAWHERLKANVI